MLQYCINVFFSGTAIVAVFTVLDSCKKALSEYRLLMHERELMGPVWAEIDPSVTLQYDDEPPLPNELGRGSASSCLTAAFGPTVPAG